MLLVVFSLISVKEHDDICAYPKLPDGYSMVTRSETALKKLDPSNTTLASNMPAK